MQQLPKRRENILNRKLSAEIARQLVENAGRPSYQTAVELLTGRNVKNVDIAKHDIDRMYSIYGEFSERIKGTMVHHQIQSRPPNFEREDINSKQDLHVDIISIDSNTFMIAIANPSHLTIGVWIEKQTAAHLGVALQEIIDTMREHTYIVENISLDRQASFSVLKRQFPNTKLNIGGAGDHTPRADERIRRIEEHYRII